MNKFQTGDSVICIADKNKHFVVSSFENNTLYGNYGYSITVSDSESELRHHSRERSVMMSYPSTRFVQARILLTEKCA
jgi:hypothetical protein